MLPPGTAPCARQTQTGCHPSSRSLPLASNSAGTRHSPMCYSSTRRRRPTQTSAHRQQQQLQQRLRAMTQERDASSAASRAATAAARECMSSEGARSQVKPERPRKSRIGAAPQGLHRRDALSCARTCTRTHANCIPGGEGDTHLDPSLQSVQVLEALGLEQRGVDVATDAAGAHHLQKAAGQRAQINGANGDSRGQAGPGKQGGSRAKGLSGGWGQAGARRPGSRMSGSRSQAAGVNKGLGGIMLNLTPREGKLWTECVL